MKNTVRVSADKNNNTNYFYTGSSQIQRLRPVTWQLPSFHYLCKDTSILFTQPLLAQTSILLPQPLLAYNKYSFPTASSGLQVFFLTKTSSGSDLNTEQMKSRTQGSLDLDLELFSFVTKKRSLEP